MLLNCQLVGMLAGSVAWGIAGDRLGRRSALLGSILLYSLATLANGLISSVPAYAVLRVVAGIGLAGELGAAVTLVCEVLPRSARGYGTTAVTAVGILGAVAAALVGEAVDWRSAYIIGGVMGLGLLGVRFSIRESDLFVEARQTARSRGSFLAVFRARRGLLRYAACVVVGMPIWFAVGILVTFAPEFAAAQGVRGTPTAGRAVLFTYIGITLGDVASGVISQRLGSRRKVAAVFIVLTGIATALYLGVSRLSVTEFYLACGLLGFAVGYWAILVTLSAEQFGTNVRALVATTVPALVRAAVVPLSIGFRWATPSLGPVGAAGLIAAALLLLALGSLLMVDETHDRSMRYIEHG
jgi:MFS family permease